MLIRLKSITSQKLFFCDIWQIIIGVFNKGKSAISHLFNDSEALCSASYKTNLFTEIFSKNSNLTESGISLPVFPPKTNLKLHNIPETPSVVKEGHSVPWFLKGTWSWLFSNAVYGELWSWTFIHISETFQYLSEGILLSRLLEGHVCSPCIWECLREMYS